ncbi:hypothetical protein KR084_001503 [Drosophila pseudotakahashii]|nr:hypothetical protein KR084_001503 [Drosophila pseudotakahashii]
MDNVCQYCKERRGLSVKRGGSVPKIICLLCLHLDTFGTEHHVQIKEEETIIEDNVQQVEPTDKENVLNQDPIVKEETFEEEPTVNVTIAEEDPIIKEDVLEEEHMVREDLIIKEEVIEEEANQEEYFIITECLEESAMETCLVCQEKYEHMINIFDDTQESGITIATMISQSIELRIEKGNSSPETICPTCLEFVQNAYETMQDHQLSGQLKNEIVEEDLIKVKNEPVEEDPFEEVQPRGSNQEQDASPSAESPIFHCYHCPLVLSDHISLTIHLRNHEENGDLDRTKEPPHRCPHCEKMFLYASKFKNHIRSHDKPIIAPAPQLKCPQCPKIYFKAGNLEAHMVMHRLGNSKKEPPFRCPYCPKIFLYDSFFQVHMRTHKDNEKKTMAVPYYKCPYCPRNFLDCSSLDIHIRTHDGPKKEPAEASYKCPDCPEVFSDSLLFNNHMETHKEPPKFECSLCHKSFPTEKEVQCHNCSFKAIKCRKSNCRKLFKSEYYLRKHYKSSHMCFKCFKCQKEFGKKATLKKHIRGQKCKQFQRSQSPGEVFQCTKCPLTFRIKADFKKHQAIHPRDYAFKCTRCSKAFPTWNNLHLHYMNHRKISPHRCDHCPLSFMTKLNLQKHTRTHNIRADGKRKCSIRKVNYNVDEDEEQELNIAQSVKCNKRVAS